jgi:hypothetical protein
MAELGAIALRARGIIPTTWDALARSDSFGEMQLQFRVDYVKSRLFGTVADAIREDQVYTPTELMLAAKKVVLDVIPAGADYWSNQAISITTTGTNETASYPDRIASLWRIHARLLAEVDELETETARRPKKKAQLPIVNTIGVLRTPDPHSMPLEGPNNETQNQPNPVDITKTDPAQTPTRAPQ